MVLAIEADGASYHSAPTARDRDRLRQQHLERLGWRFHRIWSADWFRDPAAETARARTAYERAVADADAQPIATADHGRDTDVDHPADVENPPQAVRGRKPRVPVGLKIDDYSDEQLITIVRWVQSDGMLRTTDQLLAEAMRELGFRRRGARIVQRIRAVIAITQAPKSTGR